MVRSADYLQWAKEFYGLPLVTEDYFRQNANRQLWTRIKSVANWTPSMLPLEEWDGVVFVGCVEPPEDIQWSFPVQYVLASARDLKLHWQRCNGDQTKVSTPLTRLDQLNLNEEPATPPAPPPAKPVAEAKTVIDAKPAADIKSALADFKLVLPKIDVAPEEVAIATENTSTSISVDEFKIDPPSEPRVAPAASQAIEIPEGFNFNMLESVPSQPAAPVPDVKHADDGAPSGLSFSTMSLSSSVVDIENAPTGKFPSPPMDEFVEIVETSPPDVAAAPPIVETPRILAAPPPVVEAPPPVKPPPPVTAPVSLAPVVKLMPAADLAASGPPPNSGPIDSDKLAPTSLDLAKTTDESIAWVFQQLKQHFSYSWLLYMHGSKLYPWRWDSAIGAEAAQAVNPIDLSQPSLFRIVTRTRMPYHGHIVESPINTSFFQNWGLRKTPPHITAVPLMSDSHMVGMLICAGDIPSQSEQVLRFTEKLATALTTQMLTKKAA